MRIAFWSSLLVVGLGAALALASSPEPPVRVELKPLSGSARQGASALELRVIATSAKDANEYTVKVKRAATSAARGLEQEVAEPLALGTVTAAQPVVMEDSLQLDAGKIVHARYELEIKSADGKYHGFLVLDQAFARGADGSLKAIDFAEEMRLKAGKAPVVLSPDQKAAGGNTRRPGQD